MDSFLVYFSPPKMSGVLLDTGRYANAEEVLAIALQLLTRLDTEHQAWIEETRQKIAIGLAELDRGEGIDGPTTMNQYLQQFQAAKQSISQ